MSTFDAPPGAEEEEAPRPIGVPEGYIANRGAQPVGYGDTLPSNPEPIPTAPRYREGNEYDRAGDGPERIARLQAEMEKAGLLNPPGYRKGVWDDATRDAYTELLSAGNRSGKTWQDVLVEFQSNPPTGKSKERLPLVTELTNPDELRRTAKAVIANTLGKADPALIERFVSTYQAAEAANQRSQYDMAETGGTIVSPASPIAAAEALARKADPVQAEAYGTYQRAREFFDLLGGD